MHLVVVGDVGGVVAFEVVHCLGEGLVEVHLHVLLRVSRGQSVGLALFRKVGDVVGVGVPLV